MDGIWLAAREGDLGEIERLVGEDPDQLDAGDGYGWTPLMVAAAEGHVGVATSRSCAVLLGHPSAKATINQAAINR
jgi:hypothetical protein